MITLTLVTVASIAVAFILGIKAKTLATKNKDLSVKYESVKTYAEQFAAKKTKSATAKPTQAKRGRKPKNA